MKDPSSSEGLRDQTEDDYLMPSILAEKLAGESKYVKGYVRAERQCNLVNTGTAIFDAH